MGLIVLLQSSHTGIANASRSDSTHVSTLASKIRELTNKVGDIQREQRYMREVEATFRNASESTNSKAVWWSIVQIGVLVGAAIWQMRYLKVGWRRTGDVECPADSSRFTLRTRSCGSIEHCMTCISSSLQLRSHPPPARTNIPLYCQRAWVDCPHQERRAAIVPRLCVYGTIRSCCSAGPFFSSCPGRRSRHAARGV